MLLRSYFPIKLCRLRRPSTTSNPVANRPVATFFPRSAEDISTDDETRLDLKGIGSTTEANPNRSGKFARADRWNHCGRAGLAWFEYPRSPRGMCWDLGRGLILKSSTDANE